MKILCAGLSKTGTKSLAKAFRILGYKVYDFDDQFYYFLDKWEDLFYRDKIPDFKRMFADVDVLVDSPSNIFFEDILKSFPDAKVLLTERDEVSWANSVSNQLTVISDSWLDKMSFLSPTYRRFKPLIRCCFRAGMGSNDPRATNIFRQRFRWHNDRVKAVVPAEKLLVYDIKEGWKPLCDFFGHEIPPLDKPFPHINVGGEIMQTFQEETDFGKLLVREEKQGLAILVAVIAMIIFIFYQICT